MEEIASSSNNTKNNNNSNNTPIYKTIKKQNVNSSNTIENDAPYVINAEPISQRDYLKGLLEAAGYTEEQS